MTTVSRVCVFCGSSTGTHPAYKLAAQSFGRALLRRGKGLVYGVLPEALAALEVGHEGLTELFLVPNMHARKAKMAELSDAFVAMPGGYGTLEELFEVVTWAQLGLHDKPIALLNVAGYFDGLLGCIDSAVAEGFIRPEQRRVLMSGSEPDALLDALERFEPVEREKWLRKPEET